MLVTTILSCYFYYFMEWLFFFTRPSMFSYLTTLESVEILFIAPLPVITVTLIAYIIMAALSGCASQLFPSLKGLISQSPLCIPVIILTCTGFLLLDNYTYTLFRIASPSATTLFYQSLYWIVLTLFFFYFLIRLIQANSATGFVTKAHNSLRNLTLTLIGMSCALLTLSYSNPLSTNLSVDLPSTQKDLPNILFFSADGVNSSNMSVYGYERETTPFLDSIADESLIYHNHWTNSAKTTGSIGALLSGQYPTRTRLIFRPDTFKGEDMFKHLPGILLELGYYNIDISLRHYIDADDLKLRNAFNYANHRHLNGKEPIIKNFFLVRWPTAMQFIEENWQRLYQRIAHLSGYIPMGNPFKFVDNGVEVPEIFSDRGRVNQLKQQILDAPKPFFANVHLLGPHGSKFDYEKPIFTKTKQQAELWMMDHYDNAIYQWDSYSREIYQMLEDIGELDNTVMVFSSDHGLSWAINETLPLIIRYPGGKHAGYVVQPSQRLDLAPTVLAYLGVTPPDWMDGHDLMSRADTTYPIFIVRTSHKMVENEAGKGGVALNLLPPFYSLGNMSMAYCGMLYSIDIKDVHQPILSHQRVHSKTEFCSKEDLDQESAYTMILNHLTEMGYDTALLANRLQLETRSRKYNVRLE